MGQYKLAIYFAWSIGLAVKYEPDIKSLSILLPFIGIYIGFLDCAEGVEVFGKQF